jgi:hypothetical protein
MKEKKTDTPLERYSALLEFIVLWFAKLVCVMDVPYSGSGPEICKYFRFSLAFLSFRPKNGLILRL